MRFINPYETVDFANTPRVLANTHEHIYNAAQFKKAYERGVRIFACINYYPSAPSVSTKHLNDENEQSNFSNWKVPVVDWKTVKDFQAGGASDDSLLYAPIADRESHLTTRLYQGGFPTIEVGGQTISTKLIPQIANAEHTIHLWKQNQSSMSGALHHNILGNLLSEPSNGYIYYPQSVPNGQRAMTQVIYGDDVEDGGFDPDGVFSTLTEETDWRHTHMPFSLEELFAKYLLSENQQFSGKVFGTINHTYADSAELYFKNAPTLFRAMELFNSYMSPAYNSLMRSKYDELLRKGYRIYVTSVVDWQDSTEQWGGLTPEEQAQWTAAYNALTPEEQAQYGSKQGYYAATVVKECKPSRGANVLYIDGYDESSIDTLQKAMDTAEDGLDSYLAGRYVATGVGHYRVSALNISGSNVSFEVTGTPSKIKAITSERVIELSNTNSISVSIQKGEMYVRFEAYYNNTPSGWNNMTLNEQYDLMLSQGYMDFLFTNPIFIEGNEKDDNDTIMKSFSLGII